ncbi:MAG: class I SAM-dependent methyltransferase [Gemmatimonadota bacterium]|jgi:SAM-dependent methyltransferase|nr:class I SAM-dependent methyltransferase [Gemmatimonadota bacterium]
MIADDETVSGVAARAALRRRVHPEVAAGGFTRVDGTVEFYTRVNALLRPDMVVVDYGAGRGRFMEDESAPLRRDLCRLQGKVTRVVGLDLDDAVLSNPVLDEAHVIDLAAPLPLASNSVDLVLSDYTFEHVDDPATVSRELTRILKSGGWICARTPNRFGYIGVGTNIVPNDLPHQGTAASAAGPQGRRRISHSLPAQHEAGTAAALRPDGV